MNRERTEATMTDREALAAAAGRATELIDDNVFEVGSHWHVLVAAGRKQLAQLPANCEHGESDPHGPFVFRNPDGSIRRLCPGKVYPAKTVEKIARVLRTFDRIDEYAMAVAVLDALNGETE